MIIVHHLNHSRSQRILWALEELGVPYEIKRYERDAVTNLAPASLKLVHPLGKSPVITDNIEGEGEVTVAESGAIIEYLVQQYGNGEYVPAMNSKAGRDYMYWMHFSEGSLMQQLLIRLIFEKVVTSPMPFFVKPIAKGIAKEVMKGYVQPNIDAMLEFIESHLAKNEWFAGDKMSGADFQMSFPLEASVARGIVDERYPHIRQYVAKIHARPAYQAGLEKGGEYDYA
jgi:glutathione S-transferase